MNSLARRLRGVASSAAISSITAAWLLGGCTGGLNQSDDLLDAPPLPALAPPLNASLPPGAGEPSLSTTNGLDRRHWPVVTVASPSKQVEVQPTYVTELLPDRTLARQRGEFPTGATVLDGAGDPGAQALEAAANTFGDPFFIPAAPVQMLLGRWWWITEREGSGAVRLPPDRLPDPWVWIEPPALHDESTAPPPPDFTAP